MMPDVWEVYEMVTKQKPPEPGALERQQKRQVRTARNKKFGAFAFAAVIGVAAIVLILATGVGEDPTGPANPPTTAPSLDHDGPEVARDFLDAHGAFDVIGAQSYLAAGADLSGLTSSVGNARDGGPEQAFRLHVSLLEAVGYEQLGESCEEVSSSASGATITCTFDFHFLRSDEIGLGPFGGSSMVLRVYDGQIVRASVYWDTEQFSPQVWEPFAEWVSTTYPEDAAVMYADDTYSGVQLTNKSIRLWERHSREYVNEVAQ